MKNLLTLMIALSLCMVSVAQKAPGHSKSKHKKAQKTEQKQAELPSWAVAHKYDASAHVYFPDYYTYYDPARGGYVFWNKGAWTFTPAVPPFLEKVDLGKSRIQILKGLSLDLHPELNFPYYMKQYPPDPNNNMMVPSPIPGNPAGN